MAITHCGIWDADVNLFIPSAIVPTTVTSIISSTVQSKWGAGSLKHTANLGRIIWTGLTGLPLMKGSITYWFFPTVAGSGRKRFLVDIAYTGSDNEIYWYVDSTSNLSAILMYDSLNITIINQALNMAGMISGAWNYTEANWDLTTGEINVYLNTSRIYNGNVGTSYIRTDTTNKIQLDINKISGTGLEDYVDDLCIWNVVKHTGNPITVPTEIYCAVGGTPIYFGYPFGFRNSRF